MLAIQFVSDSDIKFARAMIPGISDSSPASSEICENGQNYAWSSSPYHIKIFARQDLLVQPFLPELRTVINASYRDHDINPIGKIGHRIQYDTQVVHEIGSSGFTAVTFASNEIVGTASVRDWVPEADGIVWKLDGYYAGKSADEAGSMQAVGSNSNSAVSDTATCEGDFEIFLVAVKPGEKYRKKGIAERLVKACEEEIKRQIGQKLVQPAQKNHLSIMLKVVREINGEYWLKKGFKIMGECYCPPFTWDLEKAFVLWAMRKELPIS
ncbi:hypothetical protein N7510_002640 [Penicillium lagena]|uniref:uncharacterized protein n=1 Tax=Penicillium lagena TaxID=94218 RepID=UPI002541723F|nr:uncharacterized protein N7510_002640 [Penicillium lagena]KAJ5626331.1 hypothetical protein N7510_002640 [Penicillium lagena]